MGGIKTIDEMLSAVAANLNVRPSESKPAGAPRKTEPVKTEANPLKKEHKPGRGTAAVNLKNAKILAAAAECAAELLGISVVTAVVNEGARLVCLEAMDNSYIASVDAAQRKAYTAAALKMPTYKALEESRGGSLDGLTNVDGLLLLAGGEPLFDGDRLIGAVGVSGGTKEQDALLAKTAAAVFEAIHRK